MHLLFLVSWQKYINQSKLQQLGDHLFKIVFQILILSILFIILKHIGDRLISRLFASKVNTNGRLQTIKTLTHNAFAYLMIFFYLYWFLSILGVPVGTLIAGAGIFSLAIGFGAQGFVKDIINGFFILMEQQFDVGDNVTINNISGTISAMGLRTTQVRSADGTLNFIPNRSIAIVSNHSRNDMRVLINLHIFPNSDLEQINQLVQDVNKTLKPQHPEIKSGPTILGIKDLGDGELVFQVLMYVENGTQSNIQSIFLQAYLARLNAAGITIPTSATNNEN